MPASVDGARAVEAACWTSPEVATGFAATELIASWNATTPPGSWIEVEVSATLAEGSRTGWFVLGRWAETDADIEPASVSGQDDGRVLADFDVLRAHPGQALVGYRLRVRLLRRPGTPGPTVAHLGAMASAVPTRTEPDAGVPSPPDPAAASDGRPAAWGRVLDVPRLSQQVHRGEYPQWDSGGESWCSPTSTTMVLGHWDRWPDPAEYSWVDESLADRVVDHAARRTFDHNYRGAGNWSFNTAYAARYGVRAYVTRLRGLHEAEAFVAAGVPLVASVSFTRAELDGAGYETEGHLLTIVGFTEDGDVVSHDPASHGEPSNDAVRAVYDRTQFERVWLGPSGGLVYVIHPLDVALPDRGAEPNW